MASFAIGRECVIEIRAEANWDVNRGIFYEVRDQAGVIIPETFFATDDGKSTHHYSVIFAENQQVVGVLETDPFSVPHLVIIHDFATGESWPRWRVDERSYDEKSKKRWQAVLDLLKKENPRITVPTYFESD